MLGAPADRTGRVGARRAAMTSVNGGTLHVMPVPARDAATVMLVRDATDDGGRPDVEVCMLRRNLASEFVAGAYVFPGGSVDPDDSRAEAMAICDGRDDVEASAILGIESGGLAFWVAALRECFEESGVLVARRRPGGDDRPGLLEDLDDATTALLVGYRHELNAGRMGIVEVCRREGLLLAVDAVYYVSHWITPEVAPRRFDTRFFVTTAPRGQDVRHDEGETIASLWIRPSDALARYRAGEIELLPPTVANFRALAGFTTSEEVMAWAATVTAVPTVLPIVEFDEGEVIVFRPGDEGYDEAAARAASGEAFADGWPPPGATRFGRPPGTGSLTGTD
jgi:8-oxo-dGTP pyrophosphatase MutT (NUDIX family)